MNLQETSHVRGIHKGFTLIEMLLVVSLLLILGVLTLPVGLSFYTSQQLHQTAEGIHDALKRAQIYAQTGRHDSAYGVRIQTDEYILFEGESYSLRDVNEDQVFPVRGGVSFDGINEIVFEAHTGVPDTSGSIGVHTSSRSSIISVTEEGRIDH